MESSISEGIQLFNTQKFFEAHEALEIVWLQARGEQKTFLHGLIQVAAAFHHFTRDNLPGFRSLLEKGLRKLEKSGEGWGGIQLADLLDQLQPWRELARQLGALPPSRGPQEIRRSVLLPFPRIAPAPRE